MRIENRDLAAIVLCLILIGAEIAVILWPYFEGIPFETIDKGRTSSIETKAEYVIIEQQDWEMLWIEHHYYSEEVPELPFVNFTTDMIIAVFQGLSGASDEITIRRIVFSETHFVVHVDEKDVVSPLMMITWPYHIVKISGYPQDIPVEFEYRIITG
ncbi:MAG: hypothetical protein ACFFCX_13200 [Candidatus Sifarchaeia archaeon]